MAQSFGQAVQGCGCSLMGLGCLLMIVGSVIGGVVLLALAGAG
jgi:hypothetical protein